jgi:hypothetical protein
MSLQSDLETQLASIISAINTKLAGGSIADWAVGTVRFNEGTSLETLFSYRDKTIEQLRKIPSESVDVLQDGVDALGHDWGEKVGDDY